jgi:hypothetical protein
MYTDVYIVKLQINFVAHLTFHVSKLKLFLCDEQKLDWKQKVQLEMDAIKHRLALEIESIFPARQTHLRSNEYLVKYKGCHHKEVVWMKIVHLEHF